MHSKFIDRKKNYSLFLASVIMIMIQNMQVAAATEPSIDMLWSASFNLSSSNLLSKGFKPPQYDFERPGILSALLPDGTPVFIVERYSKSNFYQALLLDPGNRGSHAIVNFDLNAHKGLPHIFSHFAALAGLADKKEESPIIEKMAIGNDGTIWLGGYDNWYQDNTKYSSTIHRSAYLARIKKTGEPMWQKSFSDDGLYASGISGIADISETPFGDMAVLLYTSVDPWLEVISPSGDIKWKKSLMDIAVDKIATLADGRIMVFGTDHVGSAQRSAAVVVYDNNGQLKARANLGNNYDGFSMYVATGKGSAYVILGWDYLVSFKAAELKKISPDGSVAWSSHFPESSSDKPEKNANYSQSCHFSLAVTPQGDALAACEVAGNIHLYKFDGLTGNMHESILPQPDCRANHYDSVFLMKDRNGRLLLGGAHPQYSDYPGCSWMGALKNLN